MHEAPEAFKDFLPFTIGLIKLDEGPIITAQITDVDEIFSQGLMGLVDSYGKCVGIGTPVEMVTRLLFEDGDKGPLIYGYKFRPIMVRT